MLVFLCSLILSLSFLFPFLFHCLFSLPFVFSFLFSFPSLAFSRFFSGSHSKLFADGLWWWWWWLRRGGWWLVAGGRWWLVMNWFSKVEFCSIRVSKKVSMESTLWFHFGVHIMVPIWGPHELFIQKMVFKKRPSFGDHF